jgi:hypothetical protein
MSDQSKPGVRFTFGHPYGAPVRRTSRSMKDALQKLARVREMRRFVADAYAQDRDVVIEVYHASEGYPMLIHITALQRCTQGSNLIQ